MQVSSTHTKNPASGWDVSATAKADSGEKISRVQVTVNGTSEYDKSFDPAISNWQETLTEEGVYPGDNAVQVIATSDKDDDTESDDSWS